MSGHCAVREVQATMYQCIGNGHCHPSAHIRVVSLISLLCTIQGGLCVVPHGMTHGCQVEQDTGHSSIALLLHV